MNSLSWKTSWPFTALATAPLPDATVTGFVQVRPPSSEVATTTLGPVKAPPGPSWSAMLANQRRPPAPKASAGSPVNW
jgi:hypothetical protein